MVCIRGGSGDLAERGKIKSDSKDNVDVGKITKKFDNSGRSVTDKYWCSLFVIVFPIWIGSLLYAHFHHSLDTINDSDNCTVTNNQTKLVPFYIWGKSWLFDAVTCNMAFLSEHYEDSGPIVIWINVLFCGFLIIYSLSSMRNDAMFYMQLEASFGIFTFLTIYHRLAIWLSSDLDTLPFPHYEKLRSWFIPEVIIVMTLYIKRSYAVDYMKHTRDKMWPLRYFVTSLTVVKIIVVLTIGVGFLFTALTIKDLDWSSILFYVIVGSASYLGLTIFYFGLMVYSCIIDMSMGDVDIMNLNELSDESHLNVVWRAFFIIGRYHFGTACYHATLVLPRLATLFVSNDAEVKKLPEFSNVLDRHYLTQSKLHNLSLIVTAVCGSDHSESIRKLSRIFNSNMPKLEYFQAFSQIWRSLLALLMSTNSLLIITLWTYGLDDPLLSLATWKLYTCTMFIVINVMMKLFDMSFDTISFYMDHVQVDYPQKRWVFVEGCLLK